MFKDRVHVLDYVLNQNSFLEDYFFLRGCTSDSSDTSDADILVDSRAYSLVIDNVIKNVIACEHIKLVAYMRKSYFFTLTIVYKERGTIKPLKIDLINDLGWYGINSSKTKNVFSFLSNNQEKNEELKLVISHIQKLATAGRSTYHQQVLDLLQQFSNENNISFSLVNKTNLTKWERWKLRYQLSTNSSISALLGFVSSSLIFYMRNNFLFNPGKINLSLSGMDGAGKSTLIEELKSVYSFEKEQLELIHLVRSKLPMPHQLLKRKKTTDNYLKPYSEEVVDSKISSTLRLSYYLVLFLLDNSLTRLANINCKTVVYDRCSLDFFVDLSRSKIKSTPFRYHYVNFLNRNRVNLCLCIEPATSMIRKDELTLDKAEYLFDAYHKMAEKSSLILIDAEQSKEKVLLEVLQKIEDHLRSTLHGQ